MTEKDKKEIMVACLTCDTNTYHDIEHRTGDHDSGDWGVQWWNFQIIRCRGCRNLSFRKEWGSDDIIGQDSDGEPIYESNEEIFPSRVKGRKRLTYSFTLPHNIQRVYFETHQAVCSKQPILAGMGIRAIVDAVCVEKKSKGRNLQEKINDLVNIGVLTKEGAEILHFTRIFGNDAAHEAIEVKEEDLNILMDLAENLLTNTYILPKRAERLQKRQKTTGSREF